MESRYFVYGEIIIPVCFQITSSSGKDALDKVKSEINSRTISIINGDVYTNDDKCYPLIATSCEVNWFEVNKK